MSANEKPRIVLASASPRRRELLAGLGIEALVLPADVDEDPRTGEAPLEMVLRLARAKAERVASARIPPGPPCVVIGADTAVVVDGRSLGKPADADDAERMLRLLAGRAHQVMTGVWLCRIGDGRATGGVEVTRVVFRDYDAAWARAYARSGEPLGKAGAYAIQGAGSLLAERIEGSWSAVVGFPLERLPGWLVELGISPEALLGWDAPGPQSPEVSSP